MRPLTIAFLGCGAVTRMHSRTLAGVRPVTRRAYASRDVRRAERYARDFDGVAYASYEDAMQAADVDAIFVATPPATHLSLALAALDCGKHVIVEKPAFPRAADFDLVAERARRAGRQVLVAENYFYKPLARTLRRILQDGDVGELRFIHVNALKYQHIRGWRDDEALASGGALFEGGIHWINLIANLGPRLRRIHTFRAGGATAGPERSSMVVGEYESGAVATLAHSWEIPSLFKGARLSKISGTEGSITFESNGAFVFLRGRRTRLIFPGIWDLTGYRAMFEDFVYALHQRCEPQMTLGIARRDVELLEHASTDAPEATYTPARILVGA